MCKRCNDTHGSLTISYRNNEHINSLYVIQKSLYNDIVLLMIYTIVNKIYYMIYFNKSINKHIIILYTLRVITGF